MAPQTRFARAGDISIAYQVLGDAPRDLILVPGWVSNVEVCWEWPTHARFLSRLASFSRLILFDKRGTGLSDRVSEMPTLETRMDDVRAVMDAVGSQHAALFGSSEGGPMCALFAATYPDRTSALIMHASFARVTPAPGYPWGRPDAEWETFIEQAARDWGTAVGIETRAPSLAHDERFRESWSRFLRLSASPAAFAALYRMNTQIDVRHVLPAIRVPTLILHSVKDQVVDIGGSRYMAEQIPGTKLVELILDPITSTT